ncbi:cathepsin l [Stylonychia lemnae]|uniref:Cathepsin l n=1 Tax=Stylonychia lemnae TaxID=5949 RepID=A0A078BAF6_STYLE|nr:cathepsin l [Stylonychia lemnae]|eukprot:CDW90523.1 cathepsin l [Stylonychia lemnae]
MRTGFAISLAVVGVVAAVAVIALSETPSSQSLYTVDQDHIDFVHFMSRFGKAYKSKEEFEMRLQQYKSNIAFINNHNSQNDGTSFTLGPNHLADYTHDEYKKMLGYKPRNKTGKEVYSTPNLKDIPDSIDWREKGAVNAVKDQGQCGSCWAFSTIASLESRYFIETGKLQSLSEQQLVDCSKNGNEGCNGGDMGLAMDYIASAGGVETEKDYPYVGKDQTCAFEASKEVATDKGHINIVPGKFATLQAAIAEGPVSVAIEADSLFFQFYRSGIFDSSWCGTNLDHGVAAVGYGVDNGKQYYIVRNSWSDSWGLKGYINIIANGDGNGMCGIQMEPVVPQL